MRHNVPRPGDSETRLTSACSVGDGIGLHIERVLNQSQLPYGPSTLSRHVQSVSLVKGILSFFWDAPTSTSSALFPRFTSSNESKAKLVSGLETQIPCPLWWAIS